MEADLLRNNYLQLGVSACKSGYLEQAAKLLEAGIAECERQGLNDLGTAALLYNLAVVHKKRGLSAGIEDLLLKAMKLCKQSAGKDHPALPVISRSLADFYYSHGNLASARYHYKQALKKQSLPQPEKIEYLMRLVAIENAADRHDHVQKICSKLYELQSDRIAGFSANSNAPATGS